MSIAQEAVREFANAESRAIRIALSHPHGNANSYHAALAFSEMGWLDHFETGILSGSAASSVMHHLPRDVELRAGNRSFDGIPEDLKRSHRLVEAASRIGRKLKPGGLTTRVNWYDVLFCGHDFQVSRSLAADLDAVYAYEDGAKLTFEAAKKRGITEIYELPLGYYKGVAAEINRARSAWPHLQPEVYAEPQWKQSRKDAELASADVVVVASEWARQSLRLGDAVAKPVVAVPYGTPVQEIRPRSEAPDGPFTILFAGQIGLRKGVPHLIEAWEKLRLRDARLWMAGSVDLPIEYIREHAASFQHLGALPRAELLEVMKKADLFVFPSLAEGFGLVIGEAMAAGVPVLTTNNTGGPELITEGVEGWCVQAHEVAPLIERVEWAHQHRDELYRMGELARQRAEQWTWADYRRRLTAELAPHLV